MKLAVRLRSLIFALFQVIVTPFYALVALATFPLAPITRYRVISGSPPRA
jgi:1-acyl-sn-glycerol-3-phosphate acyltransferase